MRLKPFKNTKIEKVKTRIIVILGIIVTGLIGMTLYQSYALFKRNETHNFIQGKVGEFSSKTDFKLAVYVDGNKTNEFPGENDGYMFDSINCTNSGVAKFDAVRWKLLIDEITDPTECNIYFVEGDNLGRAIIADVEIKNQMKSGNPNFANISMDQDTGLYEMEDDDDISYYFRGTKTLLDNNVIFANHQWKIIRINGDGSIRLIYNGTCPNKICIINDLGEVTQIATSAFNSPWDLTKHVGYTYDTNTSSTIKTTLESWYNTNLASYDNYIADTVYCNDRSGTTSSYGARTRLQTNKEPSLKCINETDKYTKEMGKGNGLLTQKVGLITADEVALAGGVWITNNTTYYLYTNQQYYTLSPSGFNSTTSIVLYVRSENGRLDQASVSQVFGARPVISLSSNVKISGGNGSTSDPYVILSN